MELWIRSQDKMLLLRVVDIRIVMEQEGASIIDDTTSYILGMYKSEKRALEVLDEIQNKLLKSKYDIARENYGKHSDCKDTVIEISSSNYVYEMPKE